MFWRFLYESGLIYEDLDRFNIFEAIGMVYRELNHSQFLAYLLDPRGNHGLDDLFAKRFLQKVIAIAKRNEESAPVPISAIELELRDLGRMNVLREEWHLTRKETRSAVRVRSSAPFFACKSQEKLAAPDMDIGGFSSSRAAPGQRRRDRTKVAVGLTALGLAVFTSTCPC